MKIPVEMQIAVLLLMSTGAIEVAASANLNSSERAHGAEVFSKWCAPCHAGGPYHPGTQALEAKYLGKVPAALEERRDLTDLVIKTYVRRGVSIMPFFRKTEITDRDLDALSLYLSKH